MAEGKQATWGGRFSEGPAELMVRFSESVSFDQRLALFDIRGSQAHARMLAHVGLITTDEAEAICGGLDTIRGEIEAGTFTWDEALEDVHMNIEQALTSRVPAGAKLHTARSRNDQVATDMRLWFKDACCRLTGSLAEAMAALIEVAERTQTIYIPGYTHLQRAQPVSMAHHLLAYVEMFGRDQKRIGRIAEDANWSPLGSGAIAGTTLPINRRKSAELMGFVDADGNSQVTPNSMDAVSDRDLFLDFTHACSVIGVHLSRLAEDLILWSSAEFGFVSLPDTFTTGSSLMPQKKNPDALELIRGKSGRLHGHATALFAMVKGLPLTYNRDLQEDKPPVFDAFDTATACLRVLAGTVSGMEPRRAKCAAAVSDPALLATDVVDYLVRKGVAFRDAHHVVGALVGAAEKADCPLHQLPLETVQAINPALEADWVECFEVERALAAREEPGMPGPQQTKDRLAFWTAQLAPKPELH
jgi:argininosuccinate lyase